jgi:hypothetical protein
MKHLKTYKKLFESASLDINDWLDVKDIIQSEILDKYHISVDDVTDSQEGSKYRANDPVLSISYDNLEMSTYIIDDIYNLNRRVKELTGHFIIATNNVNSSNKNIEIQLSKTPDNRIVGDYFNLEECSTDNTIDKKSGFLCNNFPLLDCGDYNTTYETAVKILEWLNTFYTFCYRTEFDAFKLAYDTLSELYNVQIVFSLPKFEDDRYRQIVCFQFILSSKVEKVIYNKYPVFIINTNYTDSPFVKIRSGNYNFTEIPFNKRERYIDFLKTEQF